MSATLEVVVVHAVHDGGIGARRHAGVITDLYTATGRPEKNGAVSTAANINATLKQYTPLVRRLAHQMIAKLPANVEIDDLIQVGMIGLHDALGRFDAAHARARCSPRIVHVRAQPRRTERAVRARRDARRDAAIIVRPAAALTGRRGGSAGRA